MINKIIWVLDNYYILNRLPGAPVIYFPESIYKKLIDECTVTNPWHIKSNLTYYSSVKYHSLYNTFDVMYHDKDVIMVGDCHLPTLLWDLIKEKHGRS